MRHTDKIVWIIDKVKNLTKLKSKIDSQFFQEMILKMMSSHMSINPFAAEFRSNDQPLGCYGRTLFPNLCVLSNESEFKIWKC